MLEVQKPELRRWPCPPLRDLPRRSVRRQPPPHQPFRQSPPSAGAESRSVADAAPSDIGNLRFTRQTARPTESPPPVRHGPGRPYPAAIAAASAAARCMLVDISLVTVLCSSTAAAVDVTYSLTLAIACLIAISAPTTSPEMLLRLSIS